MPNSWTRSDVESRADQGSLTKVRAEHARKRNLMTLVDKNRWS